MNGVGIEELRSWKQIPHSRQSLNSRAEGPPFQRSSIPGPKALHIAPAHEELIQRGFLEEVRFRAGAEGEIVEYHFARQTKRSPARSQGTALAPIPALTWSDEERKLIEELTSLGVTPSVAQKLLREHPPEEIRRQIEYLPHRQADDPAALLVKSIVENWAPPRTPEEQSPEKVVWRYCTTCHQAYADGADHENRCPGR